MTMKKVSSSFALILMTAFALSFTMSSCKKDDQEDAIDKLEGKWDAISYIEDGEEYIGGTFKSLEMEFEDYKDGKGALEWTVVYEDNDVEIVTGEYDVTEDGDVLIITLDGESPVNFDMIIDEDDLTIEGDPGSFSVKIRAEK